MTCGDIADDPAKALLLVQKSSIFLWKSSEIRLVVFWCKKLLLIFWLNFELRIVPVIYVMWCLTGDSL